jgi:ribonucleoside-diphosphate reductase alpha chain
VEFDKKRPISKTGQQILKKRYFHPGETTWEQVADRVTDHVMDGSSNKEEFGNLIRNTYFVPNSPALVNAGVADGGLSACFVVDFADTTEDILDTIGDFVYIARKGGGCGTTLSNLRPKGSNVKGSTHGYAGGPVAFGNVVSVLMDVISQGGLRSMAIMFTMSVYHPDIIEFITAKHEEGKIHNANISVVVDNAFMEKVVNGEKYWTEFNGVKYNEYNAKDIFDMIVEGAWKNGEPGMLFQDRIDDSPYKHTGQKIQATNPCGKMFASH